MSDKDFDLDKLLSESKKRLDNLSFGTIKSDDNTSKEKASDLTFGANENSDETNSALSDDNEGESEAISLNDEADKDVADDIEDDLSISEAADEDIDTSDDVEDDDFDELTYEDELGDEYDETEDDDDFIEEYTEVSHERKLLFNMNKDENEHKKHKKKKVKPNNTVFSGALIAVIIVSISFIAAFLSIQLGVEYIGLTRSDESISFEIPVGTSSDTVADLLYQKGIIGNPSLFKTVMKFSGKTEVVPGNITLSPNMTYPSIISELVRSRKVYETVTVTFTEGMSIYKAAKLLEQKEVCSASDFIKAFNEDSGFDFEKDLDLTPQTLYKMEGFLFPDTYEFYIEDDAENVAKKIKSNFAAKMDDNVMKLVAQSGMSLYDVITLASIVQAEGDTAANMKLVASVFLNRLADTATFPNLQSDATYFYVTNTIASALGNTSISTYESLYNTYTCFGLPIGPIGNPGMDAILAVLEPEETTYYYFVTDAVTNEFYFASTLEEHNENCKKAGY